MTGSQGNWVAFWLAYLVTLCIGITLAYMFAAVSPTLAVANAALPSYIVTLLFFTGAGPKTERVYAHAIESKGRRVLALQPVWFARACLPFAMRSSRMPNIQRT